MNIANKLTIGRAVAIPFFIFFLMTDFVSGSKWIALGLFIVASFTDFLDGYIARKYNMVSNFGKFMDPLADKLLVCSALIGLLALGEINVYLVMIIIARDFIISGFRLIASDKGVVIAASPLGKIKTTMQMIMIGFMIANISAIDIISIILAWAVLVLTLVSLIEYIVKNRNVLKDTK